jgi:hemoglobin
MDASNRVTLYERIGGEAAVARMIGAFYDRVLADPDLAPFFASTPMEKQRAMQTLFFCAALDGPFEYSGRPLATVHYGRGIRPPHLARFVGHLLETLRDHALAEEDVLEIMSRIDTYSDEITGDTSVDA